MTGAEAHAYRSGLLDSAFRFSVNLKGGPAMDLQDSSKWKQKTLVGASIKVVAPTGQYDPTKLLNYGANRWAFKTELGLSQRWGHWLLDTYGAVWFFTTNPEFFSHSSDHRKLESFSGRTVVVVGAGSSAVDTAVLLHEAGASVQVIARKSDILIYGGGPATERSLWTMDMSAHASASSSLTEQLRL